MIQYKKATKAKATQDFQDMNFDEKSSLKAETPEIRSLISNEVTWEICVQ